MRPTRPTKRRMSRPDSRPGPAGRIALLVQYDGAPFAGSQRQAGVPTVQQALEDAAYALTGSRQRVDLAGRTASGQVAALTPAVQLQAQRWTTGLNHYLPAAVAVQDARVVPVEFDPRRCAVERTYEYRLRTAARRQPLWEPRSWVVREPLDRRAIREALGMLEGRHDFAAFAAPAGDRPTRRTLRRAVLHEQEDELRFVFRSESFLPHQVRRMVGQVVTIGQGKAAPERVAELLAQAEVSAAGPAAPPEGLTLVRVRYELPALADWNEEK